MWLQMWKNSKIPKKNARILSATKYNAHTEPLFKNLKLLKNKTHTKTAWTETLL